MSLNHEEIETLIAVVETGSFRAAGAKLHKAQSSISYSIKKIETDLQIKILNRDGHKTVLTEAGKVVYNKALAIQKINREISSFSSSLADGVESKINFVASAITPTVVLMEIFKEFNAEFPQTSIELKFITYEDPTELLVTGDADIVISSYKTPVEQTERFKWNKVEFMPVAAAGHQATNPGLTEEDLHNFTYLVVGGRNTLAKKMPRSQVENLNVWHITDFLIKKELLVNGLGWGYMPKQIIKRELAEGQLVKVPAKNTLVKELDIIRKRTNYYGKASQYLWQLLLKYCNNINPKPRPIDFAKAKVAWEDIAGTKMTP